MYDVFKYFKSITFYADTREEIYEKIEAFCKLYDVFAERITFDREVKHKAYVKFVEVDYYEN